MELSVIEQLTHAHSSQIFMIEYGKYKNQIVKWEIRGWFNLRVYFLSRQKCYTYFYVFAEHQQNLNAVKIINWIKMSELCCVE